MNDETLSTRLKAAAELLEEAARNRSILAVLTEEERARFLQAAGQIYCPDPAERRRLVKAKVRKLKSEKRERDDVVLTQTGIRKLRSQPVFTTPNFLPPAGFEQVEVTDNPDFREVVEPQNCYICKQDYKVIHHFYDQLCPACAELNFRKRTESADLRGRVALLTGGRVKIGYQSGIKLLRAGCQLIVTTRFPRDSAARYAMSRTSPNGAIAWRSSAWTCATRRAWNPSAATFWPRGTGSISSSTTPARPCDVRRISIST